MKADWGLATYDVRNLGVISAVYELAVRQRESSLRTIWNGFANGLVSGWSVNSIVLLQGGFPFTPQLSYNPSNNGDTRNPVRPFVNPEFHRQRRLPAIRTSGSIPRRFSRRRPTAASTAISAAIRLIGPGLATWDFSAVKDTRINERLTLQFRAEIFNLLNRANFNTPNLIVFTPSGVSGTAGAITSTSTTARQVQFAVKLLW